MTQTLDIKELTLSQRNELIRRGWEAQQEDELAPPPNDSDIEKSALSCMLRWPRETLNRCAVELVPEAFFNGMHQMIYRTLLSMQDQGRAIHRGTVLAEIKSAGHLALMGEERVAESFFLDLENDCPSVHLLGGYIDILVEHYHRRVVITAAETAVNKARNGNAVDAVTEAERKLEELAQAISRTATRATKDLVLEAIDDIETAYENRGKITGVPSGFMELDQMTCGFQPGTLIVVAGRSSMGKTAIVMNMLEHVSVELGVPAGILSLEMSGRLLMKRLLASRARVNLMNLRNGYLAERDFPNLMRAAGEIKVAPLYIDDTPTMTIAQAKGIARSWKADKGIQLLAVDYLQELKGSERDRMAEIKEVSLGLRSLARELGIPVIALAQLNRAPDKRGGRPGLSDLRESGYIEQVADVVALVYRPEYYAKDEDERTNLAGEAELIIAKHRDGPTGEVRLRYLKQCTRFENPLT